jgi:putative queuosine salvage protein
MVYDRADELGVLTSTRRVVDLSRLVAIDEDAVDRVAQTLAEVAAPPAAWDVEHHFVDGTARTAQYVLVLDALNFCFWGEPRWQVEHGGEWVNGHWALALSLKRAIQAGLPLLDARYLAGISSEDLAGILDGRGAIPLLEERAANLREVGGTLLDRYGGQFVEMVAAAAGSAVALVRLLVRDFPSFDDEAVYQGERVLFYKRAQICAADLAGSFGGESWGRFSDLDALTAFADYKVPQVLRRLGILRYVPDLAERIDHLDPLPPGSGPEVEIRASTIWGVELLREALARRGQRRTASQVDWLLWYLGQTPSPADRPYHRTRTIYY